MQLLVVRGAVELAVRLAGNRGKRLRVYFNGNVLIFYATTDWKGIRSRAICADADGVDAYAEALRDVGRRVGTDLSTVVRAVGKQDDDLALGLAVLEARQGIGQAHADGRTVVDEAALCHVDLHAVQQVQEHRMVHGHGALRVGLARKERQADVIVGAAADELQGHILRRLDAVGTKVLGQHTGADVHAKHDVDAFGMLRAPAVGSLRPGQSYHGQSVAGEPEQERQVQESLPEALGCLEHCLRAADADGRRRRLVAQPVPCHIGYRKQQKKQV